jgi:hypothetical protein
VRSGSPSSLDPIFWLRSISFPPKPCHVTRHVSFRRSGPTLNIKPLGPYQGPFGQSKHSHWLMPRVWKWALEMGPNIKRPLLLRMQWSTLMASSASPVIPQRSGKLLKIMSVLPIASKLSDKYCIGKDELQFVSRASTPRSTASFWKPTLSNLIGAFLLISCNLPNLIYQCRLT